jgi:hypothetical protein
MLVRVLKSHSNGYGKAYAKAVGDEYDHPAPTGLIKQGKLADGSQTARLSGTGAQAKRLTKGDGTKRLAKSGKGRAGTNGGHSRSKGTRTNR